MPAPTDASSIPTTMDTDTEIEPESETPQRIIAQLGAPSLQGVARLVAIVAACAGAIYLLYLTRGVLKILAISVFTATALGPVVDAVQRRRVPRAGPSSSSISRAHSRSSAPGRRWCRA
jgi:hypothetical protein